MSRNPAITPRVPPREEWSSRWAPGIHDAGQGPHPKGFGPAEPFLAQRQGDGSPLGEVLDADTQGQSDGGGELGGGVPLGGQRKGDAHRRFSRRAH